MAEPRRDILGPFKVALSGIVFTFRTQKHMRFHLYVVMIVLLLGVITKLGLREILVLLFTISLVLVAEMFNSAIEATVDLVSPSYHPLAKFAKDIAAGAVLITTIIALVVGSLLMLGENRWEDIKLNLAGQGLGPPLYFRLICGLVILFCVVVVGKGLGKRGQVLQGGLVSGHAAYGFFFAVSTIFLTDNALVSSIAILLACIIAQSRYEAKFHSIFELTLGGFAGTALALLIFGLVPR
jgi:diacylglycerol kinase (ATP)